jgi:hypothetical protein
VLSTIENPNPENPPSSPSSPVTIQNSSFFQTQETPPPKYNDLFSDQFFAAGIEKKNQEEEM